MRGIYLKCEQCEETIGGEQVTPKQQGIPTLMPGQGQKLRTLAAERGWVHTGPDHDLCPKCAPSPTGKVCAVMVGLPGADKLPGIFDDAY